MRTENRKLKTENPHSSGVLFILLLAFTLAEAGCVERLPVYGPSRFAARPATPPAGEQLIAPSGEFRAMWVSRFEWPSANQAECKQRIDRIMADLASHGFNAVVFQVRGQMDVLYPSPYEPWSEQLGRAGVDPGWDPLRFAIDRAHARGLEFHAYVNTHTAWQGANGRPPAHSIPEHPFYLRCDANGNHDWLIHGPTGAPEQWESSGYVWCAPGVPEFCWWTRRAVMHIVRNYDIDGINFDRIRVPSPQYSHDPISRARMAGPGNPDRLAFPDWTRDQVTRMLNDIYGEVTAVKPWVKISADPFGIYDRTRFPNYQHFNDGYNIWLQESQRWLEMGVVDALIPQIYWNVDGPDPRFGPLLRDWVGHAYGRHIYAGQAIADNGPPELLKQVAMTRAYGAGGNCLFSYGRANPSILDAYAAGLYARKAATPIMPWKQWPKTGTILGFVRGPHGAAPVTDAWIRREGDAYTHLSGFDGFYAILNVPPGTYTLTAIKHGIGGVKSTGNVVAAGKVTRVDLALFSSQRR